MAKTLQVMTAEVVIWARSNGFYDEPRSFPETVALLHSEVSEALEAWRERGMDSWFIHEMDADGQPGPAKPEGVGPEFADVLMRLLDAAHRHGVDLEAEYERKLAFNRTRPYRNGKVNL